VDEEVVPVLYAEDAARAVAWRSDLLTCLFGWWRVHVTMRQSLSVAVVAGLLACTGVALASPKPLPLRDRLIQRGEFAGFRLEPKTQSFSTAKAWVGGGPHPTAAQTSAEIARLHREGFVAVLTQFLDRGSERGNGLSWVMQLGSAASARAELKVALMANKAASGGSFAAFPIAGIPGAQGYHVSGGGSGADNIFFADGPFLYLVGQGWSSAEKTPPTRAGLIAAVKKLYTRVHGHPAA
jgi:hypothetical protein